MPAHPDWARWCFASVSYLLKDIAETADLPVMTEHFDDRTKEFMQAEDRAEIRITGPFVREDSKDCFTVYLDVNVLLTSRYGGQKKNPFDILKFAGLFQEAMTSPIPVWNYGPEADDYRDDDPDSQVFIGCLLPRHGKNDLNRVFNFGQTTETDKVKQTAVDGRFVMHITE